MKQKSENKIFLCRKKKEKRKKKERQRKKERGTHTQYTSVEKTQKQMRKKSRIFFSSKNFFFVFNVLGMAAIVKWFIASSTNTFACGIRKKTG